MYIYVIFWPRWKYLLPNFTLLLDLSMVKNMEIVGIYYYVVWIAFEYPKDCR